MVYVCFFMVVKAYADVEWLPVGDTLFPKLLADPEEVQTAGTYSRHNGQDMVDFSVGNNWGIAQWPVGSGGWPLQLDISGVIIPQFTLSNPTTLNDADYLVKLPLEFHHGIFSARISPFHKSSHLGDNYMTASGRQRITYSREGVQNLFAVEPIELLRIYVGETQLWHTEPDVGEATIQGGFEVRSPLWGHKNRWNMFAYLAQDEQCKQEVNWDVNSDTQIGFSLGFNGTPRRFRTFLNYFDGHSTFGQFYTDKESLLGVGIGFDF
jgi:hypothetical protein